MALLDIKIFSQSLGKQVALSVIMPQIRNKDEKLKVLWLLHGYSDNHTSWIRQTSIERYVNEKNLCVVMPDVDLSYYADMVYGNKYFTYLTKELPEVMCDMFSLSTKRTDNYVAGLSMGGYGALKVALNYPDKYVKCASLSGVPDMKAAFENNDRDIDRKFLCKMLYGAIDNFDDSINDLKYMVKLRAAENNLPQLYMCCGTEDFLYQNNLGFLAYLKSLGIPVCFEEDDRYGHVWEYWDLKIQRVLEWMELNQ